MNHIEVSKDVEELVYAYEALAYYFGMGPSEFWECTYREVVLFCEVNLIERNESFKLDVVLQEAVTNKLIGADGMSKRPKVVPLRKMFKGLF